MKIKEVPIHNQKHIYKVCHVDEVSGKQIPTGRFRVRRRVKGVTGWTMLTDTFESFEEAKTFRNSPSHRRVQRKSVDRLANDRFKDVFTRFISHKKNEMKIASSTVFQYEKLAEHFVFFNDKDMRAIDPSAIDCWINFLNDPEYKKLQNTTRINYDHECALLSSVLRYYREYENESYSHPLLDRHRKRLSARPKTSKKELRFLSENQKQLFLEAIFNFSQVYQDLAVVQVETGTRIGEVAALTGNQIFFKDNAIRIEQHLHWERHKNGKVVLMPGTKTGPSRTIPMSRRCREILERRVKSRADKIFEVNGDWLLYRRIQHVYNSTFRSLGVAHSGTHTLRHTFAVEFLDRTKDIHALQLILGHTDLQTTQVYAKYTNDAVRRSFAVYDGGAEADGVVSRFVSPKNRI